jgi:hypothetical protein
MKKMFIASLLLLGSLSAFATSDESVHKLLCKEALKDYPKVFKTLKECLSRTELIESFILEDRELSIGFYDCEAESEITYSYNTKDKTIYSGDSGGESCD